MKREVLGGSSSTFRSGEHEEGTTVAAENPEGPRLDSSLESMGCNRETASTIENMSCIL